jgi:pSer/pThr/pTyr-binding forkhead associated (FHA) protein
VSTGALVVQAGDATSVFADAFTAGRNGTLPVADVYASPRHAAFRPGPGGWTVEDLGSMNGTWLNGHRIWGTELLAKGDRVRIGQTVLTVVPA